MTASSNIRAVLYVLLFACAATLLGLTAYHVRFTESFVTGLYVPIVVELLVTSCLAIIFSLWFFIVIMGRLGGAHNSHVTEGGLLGIIWVMFLVGAAIISHRWPNFALCLGSLQVCRILDAVVAFSWINWVLASVLLFGCVMEKNLKQRSAIARERTVQTSQTVNVPVIVA